jgi:hypothetical protein
VKFKIGHGSPIKVSPSWQTSGINSSLLIYNSCNLSELLYINLNLSG